MIVADDAQVEKLEPVLDQLIPFSVVLAEMGTGFRAKFNVDVGGTGPQVVMMHLTGQQAARLKRGATYRLTLQEVEA
jgi:hypothetical protein